MRCLRSLVLASTLGALLGCSPVAHADQIVAAPGALPPRIALAISPAKVRAPYDVQVLRDGSETAPTYAKNGRFYVQGNAGERYIIRITNPTANRVEAVVSVDGLDVVDGEAGDLRKRGYVVPPYGETRIEGFRTSQADVATFRFSSVNNSYAGKKGKARNVGVIAVAIFEEQQREQQIIVTETAPPPPPRDFRYRAPYDYEDDLDDGAPSAGRGSAPGADRVSSADRAPAKRSRPAAEPTTASRAPAPSRPSGGGGSVKSLDESGGAVSQEEYYRPAPQERRERPGLGTEFGEQRSSAASFTRFVRAAGRPIAIAELRYNDTAGLMALGIPVTPLPDEGELMTRETADPFPGDNRFATPPR